MPNELTKQGMAAYRRGDKAGARQLLLASVAEDEKDVQAWLWLAGVAESDQERLGYLRHALKLDPTNAAAAKGLAQMVAQGKVSLVAEDVDHGPEPSSTGEPANLDTTAQVEGPSTEQAVEKQIFRVNPSFVPMVLMGAGTFIVIAFMALIIIQVANGTMLEELAYCIAGPLLLLTVLAIIYGIINRYFTRYTLTSRQLIVEAGVLGRSKKTIPLQRIQDVSYRQNVVERVFEIGDVMVESAGERGAIRLLDLAECKHRTEQVLEQVERKAGIGI